MATVRDIIFCMKAINVPGQGTSANGIVTAINPEYVPGLFSFSVIVSIVDISHENEHSIDLAFLDPDGNEIARVEGSIPEFVDDSNIPNEHKGVNLSLDWTNINFKYSGLYKLIVKMDSIQIGEKCVFVKGKNQ